MFRILQFLDYIILININTLVFQILQFLDDTTLININTLVFRILQFLDYIILININTLVFRILQFLDYIILININTLVFRILQFLDDTILININTLVFRILQCMVYLVNTGLSWKVPTLEPFRQCPMCRSAKVFVASKTDWIGIRVLHFGELGRRHKAVDKVDDHAQLSPQE